MDIEQFNTHESDARMMRAAKGPRVAYNVQTAMDAEHCLILHHDITQDGDDRKQLQPMAKAAKTELQQDDLTVTADAGYSNGKQLRPARMHRLRSMCRPIVRKTLAVRKSSSLSEKTLAMRQNTIVISARRASG
jgi:hypothetical protein